MRQATHPTPPWYTCRMQHPLGLRRIALLSLCAAGAFLMALAPASAMRMCAEWEPADGTLIRWPLGIPASLIVELAVDDSLYVLVETGGQESQARSTFSSWGVNLDHVRFIHADTYSHWTRDWGPLCVFDDDGLWGITDPVFNGYPWVAGCFSDAAGVPAPDPATGARAGRSGGAAGTRGYYDEDNFVNGVLADEFGCPLHALPAFCTGGNIMTDGLGTAFSTDQMLAENAPEIDEPTFRALAATYLGIDAYHFLDKPEIHGIQHIDCYAKLLDEETVLVKAVAAGHPEHACIEHLADELTALTNAFGRPYRIERVYCGSYGGADVAAYTNSLILNDKVLVPLFGISSDASALATYAEAMPGYEVLGFDYGGWYYYDALHCRTMGIFDRQMLRLVHRPLEAEQPAGQAHEIAALIDDRSEAGLIADSLRLHWRAAGGPWQAVPLEATAGVDSFAALIPAAAPATTVEYYLSAADGSGRAVRWPRRAPEALCTFVVSSDPAGIVPHDVPDATRPAPRLEVAVRSPLLAPEIEITVHLSAAGPTADGWPPGLPTPPASGHLAAAVYDLRGRRIRQLPPRPMSCGETVRLTWDGCTDRGTVCPTGMYWIGAKCGTAQAAVRCLRLR